MCVLVGICYQFAILLVHVFVLRPYRPRSDICVDVADNTMMRVTVEFFEWKTPSQYSLSCYYRFIFALFIILIYCLLNISLFF